MHRRLCGTACFAIGLAGVLAIFDDIQIKTTQFYGAEVKHQLIDIVELVFLISRQYFFLQLISLANNPPIQREKFIHGELVLIRLKAVQIAEQES